MPGLPFGGELTVTPLTIRLETMTPFRLPGYAGALFRGAFGLFFRQLACTTGQPTCLGCSEAQKCPYSTVFETPVDSSRFDVLRKYPRAPHPFVLSPPDETASLLPAGQPFSLALTLIGPGQNYLPHFIRVFQMMGADHRFGGRFRLCSTTEVAEPGRVIFDGNTRRFAARPADLQLAAPTAPVRRIRLQFVTPLRMRVNGRYCSKPTLSDITQALLRRIHVLTVLYGSDVVNASWTHPLLRIVDRARTTSSKFELFRWDRMSRNQGRRVDMDGVSGFLEAEGDFTTLIPYFQVGECLHVGSGTSMGMGRYRLEIGD